MNDANPQNICRELPAACIAGDAPLAVLQLRLPVLRVIDRSVG